MKDIELMLAIACIKSLVVVLILGFFFADLLPSWFHDIASATMLIDSSFLAYLILYGGED